MIVLHIFDQLFDFLMLSIDLGLLKHAWQERVLPVQGIRNRETVRAHGYKTREILVLCTQSIG